jgi:PAS domain S-box-containing protein
LPSDLALVLSVPEPLGATHLKPAKTRKMKPEGESLFRSLFEAAPVGIALEDLEGRPLYANPALCSMLGFSEKEMRRKHCVEFSPPEDAEKDWALFEQLRKGSIGSYHLDKRFVRKDGALIWGHLSISLMKKTHVSTPLVVAMVEDISEKKATEEKLQHLASRLIRAQEEERQRIARELHDDIAQRLSLLVVGLAELRDSIPSGQGSQSMLASDLHRRGDEVATDIQDLSHDLHTSKLHYLGLEIALRNHCEKISAQRHIPIIFHAEELPAIFPLDLQLCFFRVAQEALNNVVKHSRSAEAFVELTHSDGVIALKVKDLGVGFDPSAYCEGIGLSSMSERLRMFGGDLIVDSRPGAGTTIIATLKLEKAREATAG